LNGVFFADDLTGWAVGENGTILKLTMNNLVTDIDKEDLVIFEPKKYELYQNFPNPFNPVTKINYQLPKNNHVELSIYNLLGQKIVTLIKKQQEAGSHQVEWDASQFSSGVYIYRLISGKFIAVKKMILLQ
jgi:hypothetical protein